MISIQVPEHFYANIPSGAVTKEKFFNQGEGRKKDLGHKFKVKAI